MIWLQSKNESGFCAGKQFSIDNPSPTVMAEGMAGDSLGHWFIYRDNRDAPMIEQQKPPYKVPSMTEIDALPWNGLKVASTFSGCGGSCLGYRMAGFRVVWANEFVPVAQESYRANASTTHLDCRDIKIVQPQEVLEATGLAVGELDLFDGSPPCQAFSTAGKREKGWGKDKQYEHGAKQKNEQLFTEYIRLLRGIQPKTFIAENVSGLVKGTAKGFFLEILRELKACGYRVTARLLDAQWLGVPQTRQRIIFCGVRNDLEREPCFPTPLTYRYSVRDALPWLSKAVHDTGGDNPDRWAANVDITDRPSPSITNGIAGLNSCHFKVQDRVIHENGGFSRTECTDAPAPTITATQCRMSVEREVEMIVGNDAFKPVCGTIDLPCPTIMAGGNCGSSGEVRNPTTTERRKFTIGELRRICGFPDDFILIGSYAQQWERLGNSVPPVMMSHIAAAIRDGVLFAKQ